MLNALKGLSKLQKKTKHAPKLSALHCVCLQNTIRKPSIFLFLLFKFVAEAAPGRTDAPASKKYVTAQPHFFHIQ